MYLLYYAFYCYFRIYCFYLLYFSDYKMHPPQIWEGNGGASYSPNVAYIYIGEILCYLCY